MMIPIDSKGQELASRLKALRDSVHAELSLIRDAMQAEAVISKDPEAVRDTYADEFARLRAWEKHFQRQIENARNSLPQIETAEPDGDCMPRSRQRIAQSLRDGLKDKQGNLDPLFGIVADLCGAASLLPIGKNSKIDDIRITLQDEFKKRIKPLGAGTPPPPPPSGGGGGSVVTGAMLAKAKGPGFGKRAKKDDETP